MTPEHAIRTDLEQMAVDAVESWLNAKHIPYARTGVETLQSFNGFLHKMKDVPVNTVRYSPDFCVLKDGAPHIEVKAGKSIQRDAWEMYHKMATINPVNLIIYDVGSKYGDKFYIGRIGEVELMTRSESEKPEAFVDEHFRIDHCDYGSGGEYGVIRLKSMKRIKELENYV